MCTYIYIYINIYVHISFQGWISHVHGEFAGKFESSNLSRDNLSREVGRTTYRSGDGTPEALTNRPARPGAVSGGRVQDGGGVEYNMI